MKTNIWTLLQVYEEYYDFDKELYSLPDEGNTSVDMRLTFNTSKSDCYYTITLHNDSGIVVDWEKTHYIPWTVGLDMLRADNINIPEELTT